ncbi:ATP-binding cassette domain-containing protein [Streptococcus suis]|nr:ATP-binding cassette domain-containing protein [Streptococcus suis]
MDKISIKAENIQLSPNQLLTINKEFYRGKMYAITGPSGVGKTTIFKYISGLKKNEKVLVEPKDLSREQITQVYQDLKLVSNYTGYQNCEFPFLINNKTIEKERIDFLANQIKIDFDLDQKISQLSGGQKQKIAILRALLLSGEVFLFDEMTSNLDREYRTFILNYILKNYQDKILIFITHDFEVMEIADEVIVL